MKGLILQGILHVSLMMSAPFSAAAPTPVLHQGLELAHMIHYPGMPYLDQEAPRERSLYQELAAIPNARGMPAVQTIGIDGERPAVGQAAPHQESFSSGLEISDLSSHSSARPYPGKGAGQVGMSSVPLPGALSLFLTGLLCAAVVARKKLISYRREATLD